MPNNRLLTLPRERMRQRDRIRCQGISIHVFSLPEPKMVSNAGQTSTRMSGKKNGRQYSIEYLKYGLISSPSNQQRPLCFLCQSVLSNEEMKPSRSYDKCKTMFGLRRDTSAQMDKGLIASYNISLLIAQCGRA